MLSKHDSVPVANPAAETRPATRGLTLRAFVVSVFSLLLMGMWIEYEECFNARGGAFAENAPPNAAVSVIVLILAISGLLYLLRRSLRLAAAELVVIYCVLLTAAPLMTQGLWHRFFGLIAGAPHNQDFKTYESLPSVLWPHGENLIPEGQFTHGLGRFDAVCQGKGTLRWDDAARWKGATWRCPVLDNGADPQANSTLSITLPRYDDHQTSVLIPGEQFLFSLLLKAEGMRQGSAYTVTAQADGQPPLTLFSGINDTTPSMALPYGFERRGISPFQIPLDLQKRLTFTISLHGAGALTVHDVQFFNSEAVEGIYTGVNVVQARHKSGLPDSARNFLLTKPDRMFSVAGLQYLLSGYIPLRQWGIAAFAWTLLFGALFLGFLGLNVLLRRQWVDHEHLSFPQNILPRELFSEQQDARGRVIIPLLQNRVMWAGFLIALVLAGLKGLNFYNSAVPVPLPFYLKGVNLAEYVTNPLLKVFFGFSLQIWLSFLAIALLVDSEMLFSIWVSVLLFRLLHVFGKMFALTRYPGYPWESQQSIGSFIGYAVLALVTGRRYLAQIWRHLTGRQRLDESGEMVSYRGAVLMVLGSLALLVGWGLWTKVGWTASLAYFGFILICGITASKIRAEAGPFFAYWFPYFSLGFVSALGGFAIFNTTGMLVMAICAGFMGTSCFLYLSPVQLEMMELGRHFQVRLKDMHAGLWIGLAGGLFIGGFILLCWGYGFGADGLNSNYPFNQQWYLRGYFATTEQEADRIFLDHSLLTPDKRPLDIIHNLDARGIAIGMGVTWLLGLLRAFFTWFPLHPLGYVLATSYFSSMVFTIFVAWVIRQLVQRIAGVHGIRRGLVPFAVGMFLGCIATIILFDGASLILRAQGLTNIYNNCWP